MRKEQLVWVQLNDHQINDDDGDIYVFRQYDNMYDDDWFMSFRLEFIME